MLIGHDDYLKVLRFDSIGRDVDIVEVTKVPGLKSIGAMVYNPINDTVFVSDLTWKSIFEYSFTTRNLRTVSNSHLDSVKSMSFGEEFVSHFDFNHSLRFMLGNIFNFCLFRSRW